MKWTILGLAFFATFCFTGCSSTTPLTETPLTAKAEEQKDRLTCAAEQAETLGWTMRQTEDGAYVGDRFTAYLGGGGSTNSIRIWSDERGIHLKRYYSDLSGTDPPALRSHQSRPGPEVWSEEEWKILGECGVEPPHDRDLSLHVSRNDWAGFGVAATSVAAILGLAFSQ